MKHSECIMKNRWKDVGKLLRKSREKIGLTQQDIANKLYLKVSIIHCIEEAQAHISLPITFLQGYIKSYAKIVNISEKEINDLIKEERKDNKRENSTYLYPETTHKCQISGNKNSNCKNKKKISFVVILSLGFIGLFLWNKYHYQRSNSYENSFNSNHIKKMEKKEKKINIRQNE